MVSLTVRSLPPLYAFNTMCLVFQGVFYLWKKLPKHDVMWSLVQHSNCKITWFKASRQPSRLLYFTGYWRDHIESSYVWLQCFPPPSWYWDIILFFFWHYYWTTYPFLSTLPVIKMFMIFIKVTLSGCILDPSSFISSGLELQLLLPM